MPKKTRDVIVASSDWTVPTADGVHRRTIVKGAAWTVPVVAVAMGTPAAAASKTPTLKFTQASYSGKGCATITGVQVKRTTDGTTPDAGQVVTVKLANGYTFADGTTSYSATTNSDGLITLPDIKVPSTGGDSNFTATSGSLSAKAPVSSTAVAGSAIYAYNYSTKKTSEAVKDSSDATSMAVAPGNFAFQSSDGVIRLRDGSIIPGTETGVSTGADLFSVNVDGSAAIISYKKSDGIYRYNYATKQTTGPIKDSSTAIKMLSTVDGSNWIYQNSDGTIRDKNGKIVPGTEADKNVSTGADLVSIEVESGDAIITFKKSDGLYRTNYTTGVTTGPIKNSSDATKIITTTEGGNHVFQSSDGSIRDYNGDLIKGTESGVDTGKDLVSVDVRDGVAYISYKKSDGIYRYNYSTKETTGPIPDSSTAVKLVTTSNNFVYQNSDGSIRDSTGAIISDETKTGVATGYDLVAMNKEGSDAVVWYKKSPVCK